MQQAAARRLDQRYDTGFNLRSRRQFCSRFVREVLLEATNENLGEVITFADLLAQYPGTDLRLWKLWHLGRIPWGRMTVTPASLFRSPVLAFVFNGEPADAVTDAESRTNEIVWRIAGMKAPGPGAAQRFRQTSAAAQCRARKFGAQVSNFISGERGTPTLDPGIMSLLLRSR